MDEMTEVRALRAQAPVPDRARLAAGRARLTDAARAGERRRALWRRREFAIVAVVAAVTAVAVTAALLVGGTGRGRRVQPTTPDIDLKGMSAHDFLERAADALDKQPAGTEPTGKQWIYTMTATGPDTGEPSPEDSKREDWKRYDGERRVYQPAAGHPGLKVVRGRATRLGLDDYDSPREMYRFMAALPADGEGTLRALRARNAVEDTDAGPGAKAWNDYAEISALLQADLAPPAGLASLYRALALLSDQRITGHLVDTVTGRKVVVLTHDVAGVGIDLRPRKADGKARMAKQTLIDPRTYRVVGFGTVVDGKVADIDECVTTAVVDKAGERP
ncbi:CU044_5270 family protein [Streptomyces sp. NPDC008092]|uniref:CU044_5270 family protein n=1 Tax=Streptomyces sp. NPDC008092 TaxID=3364808 RepID=UPI0036EB7910